MRSRESVISSGTEPSQFALSVYVVPRVNALLWSMLLLLLHGRTCLKLSSVDIHVRAQ